MSHIKSALSHIGPGLNDFDGGRPSVDEVLSERFTDCIEGCWSAQWSLPHRYPIAPPGSKRTTAPGGRCRHPPGFQPWGCIHGESETPG